MMNRAINSNKVLGLHSDITMLSYRFIAMTTIRLTDAVDTSGVKDVVPAGRTLTDREDLSRTF